MSSVQFNNIPINLKVPGAYIEFDKRRARQGVMSPPQQIVLHGQMHSSGSASAGELVQLFGYDHAVDLAGRGSMAAEMAKWAFRHHTLTPVFMVPLADEAAGTQATRDYTITNGPTVSGTHKHYVMGTRYKVGVTAGDTPTEVAEAIVAEVNANLDALVTAANTAGVVTYTAKHKGIEAGQIDIRDNYFADERNPAGLTATIGAHNAGSGNPDVGDAVAAMGDEWLNTQVMPWLDAANLTTLEDELADRWGPLRPIEAHAFAAATGTMTELVTLGNSRNSPHLTIMDANGSPMPTYAWAAAIGARDAAEADPARPRQTLDVRGLMPGAVAQRRTFTERNTLLLNGISTHNVDAGNRVRIERLISTYEKNVYGLDDDAYYDVTTLRTLSALRYTLRVRILERFPRAKLGQNGSRGKGVVTPNDIKGEIIALYTDWEAEGWVEGGNAFEQFKQDLIVEIDDNDPNQVNALIPPNTINQLRKFAGRIEYIL